VGNYALVLGNLGFPRLELRGSGITTLITNIAMLALMILYMQRHRRFRRYHVFARVGRLDWARLRQVLEIGIPIGFMTLAEVGLFVSAAFLMGLLGNNEVAAHGVALQFGSIAFMVPLGLSQATTVRVGYAFGSGSREGVAKAGWMSLWLTLGFMSLTCLLFISMPGTLVSLFLNPAVEANRTAWQLAASYLVICGIFQLVDGSQVTAGAALRGLSDTRWPLVIAIFGYWLIGMPVAWLGGFVLGGRGIGIWIGLASGLAATAIILVIRFALRERLGLLRPTRAAAAVN
jgi:MATE family multidrug resistance protein